MGCVSRNLRAHEDQDFRKAARMPGHGVDACENGICGKEKTCNEKEQQDEKAALSSDDVPCGNVARRERCLLYTSRCV